MWHVIWHGQEQVLHPLLGGQGPVDVEDAQTLLWHHPSLGRLYAWGVSIYRSTSCSLDHSKLTHCWNQQTYSFCKKKCFWTPWHHDWAGAFMYCSLLVFPSKKLNISQHDNSTACQATQVGAAFGGGVGGVQATPQGLGHLDWLAWKTLHWKSNGPQKLSQHWTELRRIKRQCIQYHSIIL
jgi:hypothetical protein